MDGRGKVRCVLCCVVLYCTVLVLYMKREKGIDIHRLPAE